MCREVAFLLHADFVHYDLINVGHGTEVGTTLSSLSSYLARFFLQKHGEGHFQCIGKPVGEFNRRRLLALEDAIYPRMRRVGARG